MGWPAVPGARIGWPQAWQNRARELIRVAQAGQIVSRSRSCSVKLESQKPHAGSSPRRGPPHAEQRTTAESRALPSGTVTSSPHEQRKRLPTGWPVASYCSLQAGQATSRRSDGDMPAILTRRSEPTPVLASRQPEALG